MKIGHLLKLIKSKNSIIIKNKTIFIMSKIGPMPKKVSSISDKIKNFTFSNLTF
jgi:hypothetical protein